MLFRLEVQHVISCVQTVTLQWIYSSVKCDEQLITLVNICHTVSLCTESVEDIDVMTSNDFWVCSVYVHWF